MVTPNQYIGEINVLDQLAKRDEAMALLRKLASQVKPIMHKRGWTVDKLEEFMPKNPELLGLNVDYGHKICIRLRPNYDPNKFLPWESLLGTMLHELAHIAYGPHDQKFYAFLDILIAECEALLASGYTGTGFEGPGRSVGTNISHNLPPHLARAAALDAIERRRAGEVMALAGGRRLGGSAGELEKVVSPAVMAAMAAERRARDRVWCGNGDGEREIVVARGKKEAARGGVWEEWECPRCTLMNRRMALQCACCLTERPEAGVEVGVVGKEVMNVRLGWECPRCTLVNAKDIILCTACNFLIVD